MTPWLSIDLGRVWEVQKVVISPPAAGAGVPPTSRSHLFTVRVGNATAVANVRNPDQGTLDRRQAFAYEGAGHGRQGRPTRASCQLVPCCCQQESRFAAHRSSGLAGKGSFRARVQHHEFSFPIVLVTLPGQRLALSQACAKPRLPELPLKSC